MQNRPVLNKKIDSKTFREIIKFVRIRKKSIPKLTSSLNTIHIFVISLRIIRASL